VSFSVNFIQGDDQYEADTIVQYSDVARVPMVGEKVRISSTHNEYGEKVSELPISILEGVVQRISFTYDEYRDPDGRRDTVQIVNVFLNCG